MNDDTLSGPSSDHYALVSYWHRPELTLFFFFFFFLYQQPGQLRLPVFKKTPKDLSNGLDSFPAFRKNGRAHADFYFTFLFLLSCSLAESKLHPSISSFLPLLFIHFRRSRLDESKHEDTPININGSGIFLLLWSRTIYCLTSATASNVAALLFAPERRIHIAPGRKEQTGEKREHRRTIDT